MEFKLSTEQEWDMQEEARLCGYLTALDPYSVADLGCSEYEDYAAEIFLILKKIGNDVEFKAELDKANLLDMFQWDRWTKVYNIFCR